MIVVIDYQMGNVGSVLNMLQKLGHEAVLSARPSAIEAATRLILPGVGAFDTGMRNLAKSGLVPALRKKVLEQKAPVLGICLGMQLFASKSEEGGEAGLGWVDGQVVRLNFEDRAEKLKVPHMGWNTVRTAKPSSLFLDLGADAHFYFVHSYHVVCNDPSDVLTTTPYGYEFVSSVQKENIVGVQFHPEKSLRWGMRVLKNFVERC
jgi:glutamine amidotransferase